MRASYLLLLAASIEATLKSAIDSTNGCRFTALAEPTDTVETLAARYGMTPSEFRSLQPANITLPGAPLVCIPQGCPVNCTLDYTLQTGETCDSVAALFNLSPSRRLRLNPSLDCGSTSSSDSHQLCLRGSIDGTFIGGPISKPQVQVSITSTCLNTVTLSSKQTCVDLSQNTSMPITRLASWNKGIDCWNLRQGQELCINATIATITTTATNTSSTGFSPVAVIPHPPPLPTPFQTTTQFVGEQ
ncbi:hypothetical protein BCR33DRAFT_712358, partial [Rhizoclosmatium globosum]